MMSHQQSLIQLPLVGAILLGLLAIVYLAARKRIIKQDATGKVIKHSIDTPPEDVLKYWTAERMRNAKAADMPNVDKLDQRKKRSPRASEADKS